MHTEKIGPKPVKPVLELQKAAAGAFAAITIASSAVFTAPPPADALPPVFSSSTVVAEKVIREGVYREYEVDVAPQQYDDARSTFKAASETKTKKGECGLSFSALILRVHNGVKFPFLNALLSLNLFTGKYTALLAILIVGSFIVSCLCHYVSSL